MRCVWGLMCFGVGHWQDTSGMGVIVKDNGVRGWVRVVGAEDRIDRMLTSGGTRFTFVLEDMALGGKSG